MIDPICDSWSVPHSEDEVEQTSGVPPPPHVSCPVHIPQLRLPPHPSEGVPQFARSAAQVVGMQPHRLGVPPPPHVVGPAHVPQSSVPPQLSDTVPHESPSDAQVAGTQGPAPHWFGFPPPPQVRDAAHVPHVTVPPHPFFAVPQVAPSCAHVSGVHPHSLGTPPPPHDAGGSQTPQLASGIALSTAPSAMESLPTLDEALSFGPASPAGSPSAV
jgi:hypothetical protein